MVEYSNNCNGVNTMGKCLIFCAAAFDALLEPVKPEDCIIAADGGTITVSTYDGGYGNYVIVDHGGNNFTLYGHCSALAVKVGDYVSQGQTIAYVGSTGNSTGPHLHFEIRLNGSCVDPAPYIAATRPRK